MRLRAGLLQSNQRRAERKVEHRQKRTEKVAYQLYRQRAITTKAGDESSDWFEAERIVHNPVRRGLYRARRTATAIRGITALSRWVCSGIAGKTSWEWLELLIIPLFLATGAFYLESRVERRQESIADARAKQATLDNYLGKMQGLLLDKGLREASEDSEVRSVARAVTTTTIKELDADRNALLFRFLREASLVGMPDNVKEVSKAKSLSLLTGLDLQGVILRNAPLFWASFSYADLSYADLSGANLSYADLSDANLSNTDLSGANLSNTDLFGANLFETNLSNTDLNGANLYKTDLSHADLRSADLRSADLRSADLRNANLSGANLSGTNLIHANLSGANLSHADLRETNLFESRIQNSRLCRSKLPETFKTDPNRDC